MTMRDDLTDRLTRLAAAFVITLFLAASVMLLSGCSAPCSGHGGMRAELGGWYYCNDGTREYG